MKILSTTILTPDSPSGVITSLLNLQEGLRQRGHEMGILHRGMAPAWIRWATRILFSPLRLFGPQAREVRELLKFSLWIYYAMRDTNKEIDLIHAQDVASGVAAGYAVDWKLPVLVSCHFNDHPVAEASKRENMDARCFSLMQRIYDWFFGKIRNYVCVSEYGRACIGKLVPRGSEIWVVPNGMDLAALQSIQPDSEIRKRSVGRKIILNAGYLEPRKNQEFVIRTARSLDDSYYFVIAGTGPDEMRLRKLAKDIGVSGRVEFHGHSSNLPSLMKASDLYLHVSHKENCPMTLIEAVGCRLPVMALSVGGIPEMFPQSGGATLLDYLSPPHAVAERIDYLFQDPSKMKELSIMQLREIEERHDLRQAAENMASAYDACIRRGFERSI